MSGIVEQTEDSHQAEMWALAKDDHMRHLLVWQRVKKRAEVGGFNGVLIQDYAAADAALEMLATRPPSVDADV